MIYNHKKYYQLFSTGENDPLFEFDTFELRANGGSDQDLESPVASSTVIQ
jgi:hypothetical protein